MFPKAQSGGGEDQYQNPAQDSIFIQGIFGFVLTGWLFCSGGAGGGVGVFILFGIIDYDNSLLNLILYFNRDFGTASHLCQYFITFFTDKQL